MAALLLLQKGSVDKPAVDELMLVEVWGEKDTLDSGTVEGVWKEMGQRRGWSCAPSPGQAAPSLQQSDNFKVKVMCGQVWMKRENSM